MFNTYDTAQRIEYGMFKMNTYWNDKNGSL